MSSEPTLRSPSRRRENARFWFEHYGPWALWGVALVVVAWLLRDVAGPGVAPAVIDAPSIALVAPRAARVQLVAASAGDEVKEGQLLVQLDPAQIDAELAVARAELRQLEAEVPAQGASLVADSQESAAQLAADAERAQLAASQLETTAQREGAELTQLDVQIAKQQQLVDAKLAAAATLDELKLRRASLARAVEEYSRTLPQARANATAATQRLMERQRSAPSSRPGHNAMDDRLAPYRAAVLAQEERVRLLEQGRTALALRAPSDGRVVAVLLRAGDTAAEGAVVATVVDDRVARAIAYADQAWAYRVHVGDRVRLRPSNGIGAMRNGRVTALGATIAEMPVRFRPIPTQPFFSREIFIALDTVAGEGPLPGQAFDASFTRGPRNAAAALEQRP